ncbi:unnamed protein product [Leptidea sinapis]|uniref:Uncharacterized protein n=1 Tax=Leptidea sinapis TaxID=189913 RepID=A0A5E4Q881_9NEOP|nr:unnamed protein product [Leptidea sinapis]
MKGVELRECERDGDNRVTVYCSGRGRRERATVRSTIYNQIARSCVSVCLLLSLITRPASASGARALVFSRPLLWSELLVYVEFSVMHSASVNAIVSLSEAYLPLNYE